MMKKTTRFCRLLIAFFVAILFFTSCRKQIDRFTTALAKSNKLEANPADSAEVASSNYKSQRIQGLGQ